MDIYQIAAAIAGIAGVASGIPQIVKLVQVKESRDISIAMYFMVLFAQIVWVIYGFHINDVVIIMSNVLAGVVMSSNLFLIIRYRNGQTSS